MHCLCTVQCTHSALHELLADSVLPVLSALHANSAPPAQLRHSALRVHSAEHAHSALRPLLAQTALPVRSTVHTPSTLPALFACTELPVHSALHAHSALSALIAYSAQAVQSPLPGLLAHNALHPLLVYSALPLHIEQHTHTSLPSHCALACTQCHACT